jgi:hypothetical protein
MTKACILLALASALLVSACGIEGHPLPPVLRENNSWGGGGNGNGHR